MVHGLFLWIAPFSLLHRFFIITPFPTRDAFLFSFNELVVFSRFELKFCSVVSWILSSAMLDMPSLSSLEPKINTHFLFLPQMTKYYYAFSQIAIEIHLEQFQRLNGTIRSCLVSRSVYGSKSEVALRILAQIKPSDEPSRLALN